MFRVMTLQEFMATSGLDEAGIAALMGNCSSHAVKKWRYRERTPRPAQMRRLMEVTQGTVTPNDFLPDTPAPGDPFAGVDKDVPFQPAPEAVP
jgi:hypothetical protein